MISLAIFSLVVVFMGIKAAPMEGERPKRAPLPPLPPLPPPPKGTIMLITFTINNLHPDLAGPKSDSDCPTSLSSIVDAPNKNLYLFQDDQVWTLHNRSVVDGPKKINQIFPNGPKSVNASVTSRDLTVLLEERTLYGYNQDEVTGEFRMAKGFPAKLHELVLFFPVAAFPLSNGSVIWLSHFNAFATYNLFTNQPSLLNNKDEFFPDLPKDLRSGIPEIRGSDDFYTMFSKDQVYRYDNRLGETVHAQPLYDYLICK